MMPANLTKGVAIAHTSTNIASIGDIRVVTTWGPKMGNHQKIPSRISYSESQNGEEQWGASLSKDAIAMINTKLELDLRGTSDELDLVLHTLDGMHNLDFQYVKSSGPTSEYTWKVPEEIVEDYLTKVCEYLYQAVTEFTEAYNRLVPTDIVITMPPVSVAFL
jgi:hypothetical protein